MKQSLLADLLSVCPAGAHVLGAAFSRDPGHATRGDWFAHKAEAGTVWDTDNGQALNKYLCVSAFSDVVRRKDTFVAQLALMIDDVGGEIDTAKVPTTLEPTWTIETSKGNYQLWYVFSDPITDRGLAEALVGALQSKGFSKADGGDTGFAGVTRYGRPDKGVNSKPEALDGHGKPWRVKGTRTGGLVTVQGVLNAFEITEADLKGRRKVKAGGSGPQSDLELAEAIEGDTLAGWLAEQGLVKRWRDDGWLDITCPWVEEHTGGLDNGTAYRLARFSGSGRGGFKCHHGSHVDRGLADLWAWAEGEGWQNPWAVPDAADEFGALDEDGETVGGKAWRREQLAEAHVWVRDLGVFFDLDKGITESSEHLELSIQQYAQSKEVDVAVGKYAQRMYGYQELDGEDKDGKPKKSFFRIGTWLRDVRGRVVDKLTWDPRQPRLFEQEGCSHANSYIAPPLLMQRHPEGNVGPWLALLNHLVPEPEYQEPILDWLAHQVQFPGVKRNWHILLGGGMRIGKDSLFQPVVGALGSLCRQAGEKEIKSDFEDYLIEKLVVVFQEIATLHERLAIEDGLKNALADPPKMLPCTKKGKGTVSIPNVVNIIAMTNREMPLNLSTGDERWFAYWSHAQKLAPADYKAYWTWLQGGGDMAVIAYLQRRKIRTDFYTGAPVTAWKESLMGASGGRLAVMLRGLLEAGEGVFGLELIREDDIMDALCTHQDWAEASLVAKRNAMNEAGIVQAKDTVVKVGHGTQRLRLRTTRNAEKLNAMTGKDRATVYWTARMNVKPLVDRKDCELWVTDSVYSKHVKLCGQPKG